MRHSANVLRRSPYYDRSRSSEADANPLLRTAVPDFLEYCEVDKGLRETTIRQYEKVLADFTGYLEESVGRAGATLRAIDLLRLRRYKKSLCNHGQGSDNRPRLCARSRNQRLAILKSFLRFAGLMGWDTLPADFVEYSRVDHTPPIYHEHGELEKIVVTLTANAESGKPAALQKLCLIRMYLDTGLRVSDMRQLRNKQFPLEKLQACAAERRIFSTLVSVQKTRTYGRIWLSPDTCAVLVRYLQLKTELKIASNFLFCSLKYRLSGPLSRYTFLRLTKEIGQDCGLTDWQAEHNHKYRHSSAMEYLHERGLGLLEVKKVLMHRSIESTLWYVESCDEQIEQKLMALSQNSCQKQV